MKALALLVAVPSLLLALAAHAGDALPRVEACERIAQARCEAYEHCQKLCPTCDRTTDLKCLATARASCAAARRGTQWRPQRATVASADADACVAGWKASARDKKTCSEMIDASGMPPCDDYGSEANGDDYTPAASGRCGPEHHWDAASKSCLLTCASDADCGAMYGKPIERCGESHSCVALTR